MVLLINVALAYNAPPLKVAELFMNLQLSMTISETLLPNRMAPPKSDFPFINVILFRTMCPEDSMLKILDFSKALIVKPLPLMVIALVMLISLSDPLNV